MVLCRDGLIVFGVVYLDLPPISHDVRADLWCNCLLILKNEPLLQRG